MPSFKILKCGQFSLNRKYMLIKPLNVDLNTPGSGKIIKKIFQQFKYKNILFQNMTFYPLAYGTQFLNLCFMVN
jgi:hypothetical protein